MKYLLIPLAFAASTAMACPGDAAKSATAPAEGNVAAVAKAAPSPTLATTAATSKMVTKVSVKPATEARKPAPL